MLKVDVAMYDCKNQITPTKTFVVRTTKKELKNQIIKNHKYREIDFEYYDLKYGSCDIVRDRKSFINVFVSDIDQSNKVVKLDKVMECIDSLLKRGEIEC